MPRSYSRAARENLNATSADEPLLMALEITHPDLAEPVRVVSDTQGITLEGHEFVACPFRCTLPDDMDTRQPRARLEVDNVGRELTQWLDDSRGGQGAKCRMIQVLRSSPEVIEFDLTLDLSNLVINQSVVSGELGFVDTLNRPAVNLQYRPETAPGLF
ncbi:DUF1833 family protein [Crenobacter cavernae]|uniref:DUF1833 domain-containing protein n=1 Tax=Crenobacter cavernae TaxID=2290923 RepID=A0ABY0FAP7_9NEIS|nr:DUF1833 family protein [Crenobacter cavernae]RXZ42716.1 DUF1833 domain-containing protein [Crenobacter cavernae]